MITRNAEGHLEVNFEFCTGFYPPCPIGLLMNIVQFKVSLDLGGLCECLDLVHFRDNVALRNSTSVKSHKTLKQRF